VLQGGETAGRRTITVWKPGNPEKTYRDHHPREKSGLAPNDSLVYIRSMSLTDIIEELPKLTVTERSVVWQQLEALTEADVPESFRQGMDDIAAGRHVDMEQALSEPPPGNF